MLFYGEELRSVLLFEKKLSASCLSHAPRPVCLDAKMSASPSPFQEDCVCVLFEPCPSSRLLWMQRSKLLRSVNTIREKMCVM